MKFIKYLLMVILMLVWLGVLRITVKSYADVSLYIITCAYLVLLYIIWPLGTKYADTSANRFLIALGIACFLC